MIWSQHRKNWNIIHFAEQLVLPPIRCFWKYGRFDTRSLSWFKTTTTLSDSSVLSRYTCKCYLIYACKKSTSLPTRIFTKLNSTMCKFLRDMYISRWLVLYPLVVTDCRPLELAKYMKWKEILNFILIGQQTRKKFIHAPKQRMVFIASIFTKLVITKYLFILGHPCDKRFPYRMENVQNFIYTFH